MCAIFGELRTQTTGPEREFPRIATATLSHRGPDGNGVIDEGPCTLGHCRLAILDTSTRAAQPMKSGDGQISIVLNGEIYNYVELKAKAPTPAGGWRTTGDTEVLVERWARDGLTSLREVVGMFAFAVWNSRTQRLWLVRDRLGKKPLYWAFTRTGGVRFASEMPALLVDDEVVRETTTDRIAEFLQHGFVVGTRAGLSTVSQVPPGCAIEMWLEAGEVLTRTHRYWALPSACYAGREYSDWLEEFRATLENAVRIRLRSDVPVGAFLSGGVDSSVVALLAKELLGPDRFRTYTADFKGESYSEAAWAREVGERIQSEHKDFLVDPELDGIAAKVVHIYGDLHGDPSAVPTIALCAQMRRHVVVALSGDGGDELLGGYSRYAVALREHESNRQFSPAALRGWNALGRLFPTWLRGTGRLAMKRQDLEGIYASIFRAYPTREWPPVMREGNAWRDPILVALGRHGARDPLLRMMACDAETYLPEDNLIKVDRASMSVGLEVRSPLLDHRLFELVTQARPDWLANGQGSKRPLRDLYASRLPEQVFSRKKMGFAPPIHHWMKRMSSDAILSKVRSSGIRDLLDERELARQIRAFSWGLHGGAGRIWYLLIAIEWWNRWKPTLAR